MAQSDVDRASGIGALVRYLAAVAVVGGLAWAAAALAFGPAEDAGPAVGGQAESAQMTGSNEDIPAPIREALKRGEVAIASLERVEAGLQRRLDELQALRAEHEAAQLEPAVARTRNLERNYSGPTGMSGYLALFRG
ncbi:MAG: hypothetical protein ACOCYP_08690, partial [Planctomycetota bacterium]